MRWGKPRAKVSLGSAAQWRREAAQPSREESSKGGVRGRIARARKPTLPNGTVSIAHARPWTHATQAEAVAANAPRSASPTTGPAGQSQETPGSAEPHRSEERR